jgi:hypothetical protein
MLIVQKWSLAVAAVVLVACAEAGAPVAYPIETNELADAAESMEGIAQTLIAREDYRAASKAYFILATTRRELNQTAEACAALSESLDYYRKSVADETQRSFREAVLDQRDEGDGMLQVRSAFGCVPGAKQPAGYAITRR